MDNLKEINHRHGHEVGNQVLKGLGQLLLKAVRGADTLARHRGGFALILSAGAHHDPLPVRQRIRNGLRQLCVSAAGTDIHCALSIGITLCSDEDSLPALYQTAQRAQREATPLAGAIKRHGGGAAAQGE